MFFALVHVAEEIKRSSVRSRSSTKRKRLVSETSVKSGDKEEAADEDEDLPDVPFSRILALNKPELVFIISMFSCPANLCILLHEAF